MSARVWFVWLPPQRRLPLGNDNCVPWQFVSLAVAATRRPS